MHRRFLRSSNKSTRWFSPIVNATALTTLLLPAFFFAPLQVSAAPVEQETKERKDARLSWWREGKFGMFIHWGVYSVPAGQYQGKPINFFSEWIMNRCKIPIVEYKEYAKNFNPTQFDPEAWVLAAKNAGMKYIVITSKHHDGFAMFETKVCDWNIMDATPYHRDVLKMLAEACRRHGMKLGFYYSQSQDWCNGGMTCMAGANKDMNIDWDPAQKRDYDEYLTKIAAPQIRELLTNYGEFPSVLWWDTPNQMTPARARPFQDLVLKLKPDLITNNRLGGGVAGDTETPENQIPEQGFPGRDWETCMTMNSSWGYSMGDNRWKSTRKLIENLTDIVSKGGNYLLNVGPTSEGLMPQPSLDRLAEIGTWMKVNGQAIYGATKSPFPQRLPWGRVTRKADKSGSGETLYLHVWNWTCNRGHLLLPYLTQKPDNVRVLATGESIPWTAGDSYSYVSVSGNAPDPAVPVLALHFPEPVKLLTSSLPAVSSDGAIHLSSMEAVQGRNGWEETGDVRLTEDDNHGINLADSGDRGVIFTFTQGIRKPVRWEIWAEARGPGGTLDIYFVGMPGTHATIPQTATWTKMKLGELDLNGYHELLLMPRRDASWKGVDVRNIVIKPCQN